MKGFTNRFRVFKEGVTTKGAITIASKDGEKFDNTAKRAFYKELGYTVTELKEFEEISVCPHCDAPTEEKFSGDDGWTFCSDGCGCLEGDKTVYKFICPDCDEICDEEKCNCTKP